jgi:hypothetical protein
LDKSLKVILAHLRCKGTCISLIQPMDQREILDFKAYYLHHTFMPLIEITDGEDKQSIRQFWKDNNVNATYNIRAAWNKVTPDCLNGVRKKLWPEACSNLEAEEETATQNSVKLANEGGLKGINEHNVKNCSSPMARASRITNLQN